MSELEPENDPVLQVQLDGAAIGDVLRDVDGRPIPKGWHAVDGSTLLSYEWPEFVKAMGIKGGTFTLPAPQRGVANHHWIIRLGERRPVPKPANQTGGKTGRI